LGWTKKSKIKDTVWENINYRPKKVTNPTLFSVIMKFRFCSIFNLIFQQYQNFDWNNTNDSPLAFHDGLGLPTDAEQIFDEVC